MAKICTTGSLEIKTSLIAELKSCLHPVNAAKVILFGSRASGNPRSDSDVDLIVILNRTTPFSSAEDYHAECVQIRRLLRPVSSRYGLDLIVFTIPDWDRFIAQQSAFAKEIQTGGLAVA